MLAQTKAEKKTAKLFQPKFKGHLRQLEAIFPKNEKCGCISMRRCPVAGKVTLADKVEIPDHDIIHVFDPETMLAVSHAIEDLASEARSGELISTFQRFENFLPQKKRYVSLARDLDSVRVWGAGDRPQRCPGIDFIVAADPLIEKYWLVLFESADQHAVLVCKQVNDTLVYREKRFVGFYSFNPYLVQSIRWRFNLLSSGLDKILRQWDKSIMLPDLKLRDLDQYMKRQSEAPILTKQASPKTASASSSPVRKSKTPRISRPKGMITGRSSSK